jgi:hypothetical protein
LSAAARYEPCGLATAFNATGASSDLHRIDATGGGRRNYENYLKDVAG